MDVYDFEYIKKKIRPLLLRRDESLRSVKKVPYIDITQHNLVLVFYVELGKVNNINLGFCVSNKHLQTWNISVDELIDATLMH